MIILLLQPKSKQIISSIFSSFLRLLLSPKISTKYYSTSTQVENSKEITSSCISEQEIESLYSQEASTSFFIKPEYGYLVGAGNKKSHTVTVLGSALAIEVAENESVNAIKGMLDDAISSTANLNPNEASSVISSSIPKCVVSSNDIHAICHQIKSIAAKYRFDPAKFENFIQR